MGEGGVQALRELAALFSIEVEDEKLEKFDKKLGSIKERIVTAGEVIVEALAIDKAKEFFETQIEGAAHLQDLATKLDVAAGELNAFQFAAKSAGVDGDQAAQSLGFLNRTIGEAVLGSTDAQQSFAKLGVNMRLLKGGDLKEVLLQAADGFAKLKTQPERAALATRLFGKEGSALLPILAQGRDRVAELYKEEAELGDGLGDEFPKQAKEAREATERFEYSLQSLKNRITSAVLPAITKFYEWAKNLTVKVLDFDKKTHAVTIVLQLLATVAAVRVVGALKKTAEVLGLAKHGMEGFLSAIKVTGPIALLYGLYLILEDIYVWAQGGKSVIGAALEKFEGAEGAKETLDNFRQTLSEISDDLKGMGKAFGDFSGTVQQDSPSMLTVLEPIALSLHGMVVSFEAIYHTLQAIKSLGKIATADITTQAGAQQFRSGVRDYNRAGTRIAQDFGLLPSDKTAAGVESTGKDQTADFKQKRDEAYARAGIPSDFHLAPGESAKEVLSRLNASQNASAAPGAGARVSTTTNVTVNVDGGRNPRETGKIVGQGAATEVEKSNDRALQAMVTP